MMIFILLGFLILLVSSFTDLYTGEVPFPLSISFICLGLVNMVCHINGNILFEYVLPCLFLFTFLYGGVRFYELGGADCLIGTGMGLYLGLYGIHAVLIAFLLTVPLLLWKFRGGIREYRGYPFVPFLAAGYVVMSLTMLV